MLGLRLGDSDGESDGLKEAEGLWLGLALGDIDGLRLGLTLGLIEGLRLGDKDGLRLADGL